MLGIKFSFWAYGILAIAALGMFLWFGASFQEPTPQLSEFTASMEGLVTLIVAAFLVYMFLKLIMRKL